MATIHEIPAESRKDEGKGASRRLRRADKVPAILYGSSEPPASIQLDHNTVWLASQHEWFYSALLDLKLDGKAQKVLLRDMQRHPFKAQLLHIDFQRVDENKAIRIRVPLHFVNQEKSPGRQDGGRADLACDDRRRNLVLAAQPAGIHRGRSNGTRARRHRAHFRSETSGWRGSPGAATRQGT